MRENTSLHSSKFRNNLCNVYYEVTSDGPFRLVATEQSDLSVYRTQSHLVRILEFQIKREWLGDEMSIESSKGWLFFLEKVDAEDEQFTIHFGFEDNGQLEVGPDSGQGLDALAISDENRTMHIGTEGGDEMYRRAELNRFMPQRFMQEYGKSSKELLFTAYEENKLITRIPSLQKGEKLCLNHICALSLENHSVEGHDEDASTWYAVNFDLEFLMKEYASGLFE